MITYLIPTRDRHTELDRTLTAIEAAHANDTTGVSVVVVDDASEVPIASPDFRRNGVDVTIVRNTSPMMAAARNVAATHAESAWLVMLDDDSHPLDAGFVDVLAEAPDDVAAVGAEILLPDGTHEAGGLPEVFVGCGVAIRRDVFAVLGGYDASFGYYAEEYDLAARIIGAGMRVQHDARFRIMHRKVAAGRDMNVILRHLVRNNAWVNARYAPDGCREAIHDGIVSRYGMIAEREGAVSGFQQGLRDIEATLEEQPRTPLDRSTWDRFTGLHAARGSLAGGLRAMGAETACVVCEGKHAWVVRQALDDLGIEEVPDTTFADARVIGTLSPGPIADAFITSRVEGPPLLAPFTFAHQRANSVAA